MRAFFAGLAVVGTLLLGALVVELYPIARIAYGITSTVPARSETPAQRNERVRREVDELFNEGDAILRAAEQRSGRKTPPPQTEPPADRPASRSK